MRIASFGTEKLFGIFDHRIDLKNDQRVTLIHGPNGFGKTTLLRNNSESSFGVPLALDRRMHFGTRACDGNDADVVVLTEVLSGVGEVGG